MVDAVEKSLRTHGLFDAVVCDYVMNSVDSVQAESDVMTCVVGLCRPGGAVWVSGRRREQVDDSMRSSVAVNIRAKRNIEFLDEHGFSGLYRMGRWFYQKFHTAQDVQKLMDAHGVMVVKNDRHHVSWQVAGVVGLRHPDDAVEAALAREFDMPLNDSGRRLGRHETAVAAYRAAAREMHGNQG
jgi:ParB family chromosome partitioning protein